MPAVLLRLLEQQLVADADAQQRPTSAGQVRHPAAQAVALQLPPAGGEGADAGQDDAVGARQLVLVRREAGPATDLLQRALDRPQVPDPVVDDGDHASPLPLCCSLPP